MNVMHVSEEQSLGQLLPAEMLEPYDAERSICQGSLDRIESALRRAHGFVDYGIAAGDPGAVLHGSIILNSVIEDLNPEAASDGDVVFQSYLNGFYGRACGSTAMNHTDRETVDIRLRYIIDQHTDNQGIPINGHAAGVTAEATVLTLLDDSWPSSMREGRSRAKYNHDVYVLNLYGTIKLPIEVKYLQNNRASLKDERICRISVAPMAIAALFKLSEEDRALFELLRPELRQPSQPRSLIDRRDNARFMFGAVCRGLIAQAGLGPVVAAEQRLVDRMADVMQETVRSFDPSAFIVSGDTETA